MADKVLDVAGHPKRFLRITSIRRGRCGAIQDGVAFEHIKYATGSHSEEGCWLVSRKALLEALEAKDA